MSSELNPDRKNPAFLAQFFNETLYHITEETEGDQQPTEEIEVSEEANQEKEDFVAKASQGDKTYAGTHETDDKSRLESGSGNGTATSKTEEPEKDSYIQDDALKTSQEPIEAENSSYDKPTEESVAKPGENSTSETGKITSVDYFGQYQQNILILVDYPNQKNLIRKDQMVLERILKALEISFDDVAIVNIEKAQLTFDQIRQEFGWQQLLAFGIKADFIPFDIRENEIKKLDNGEKVLLAPAIADIATSKSLKRTLWQNLKTLFNQ